MADGIFKCHWASKRFNCYLKVSLIPFWNTASQNWYYLVAATLSRYGKTDS
jgi:hypothetical protein